MSEKSAIITEKAPVALGPYSAGIITKNSVFTAGQLGIDPLTNQMVEGGIEAQTRQSLINIKNILEAAGISLQNVVKTTVFMKDLGEFAVMNAVYGEFFVSDFPARSTVQVAALPMNADVEIEVVAVLE